MQTKKPTSWSKVSNDLYKDGLKSGINIFTNKKIKTPRRKTRYCYLVYCNKDPIVYSVYSSKSGALKYAEYLIKYRQEFNTQKGFIVDFYHYYNLSETKDTKFDKMEKTIFTTCLSVADKNGQRDNSEFGDDGCWIKVVRKPLKSSFEE